MMFRGLGSGVKGLLMWGIVKIMVPFWVPPYYNTGPNNTGPNLRDPRRDHNFDNPPCIFLDAQVF